MTMTKRMPETAAKGDLTELLDKTRQQTTVEHRSRLDDETDRKFQQEHNTLFGDNNSTNDDDLNNNPELPDQADPAVPYSDVVKRPGHTLTEGEITLHTRMAHRLFYGRRREKNVQPIIGLVRFVSNTNGICEAARLDDPYADWRLLQIEESLIKTENTMKKHLVTVRELLSDGERRRVRVRSLGSVKPATFRLSFQYTYGFRGADLLALFDQLAEYALSAKHVGRMFSEEWHHTVNQSAQMVRHLFVLSASFRYSGACRDDFAANNARAREAVSKFGELPADVLRGDRRPLWAPAPDRRPRSAMPETGAE